MTLIRSSLPSLISGVSQQPPVLRLPSQLAEQINAHSSEVDGLRKRPPLDFTARLGDASTEPPFVHTFTDTRGDEFVVVLAGSSVRVFDSSGVEKTVVNEGAGYLTQGAGPIRDRFRALTLSDTTFFVNRLVTTRLTENRVPVRDPEAIVVIQQGSYGKLYTIEIQRNGATAPHRAQYGTGRGDDLLDADTIGTDKIATELFNDFDLNATSADGFTIEREGSILYIQNVFDDFSIKVTDEFNNNGAQAYKGRIQRFAALPQTAPEGFQLEVIGDTATGIDNYFVQFEKIEEDDLVGIWREVAAPGARDTLDAGTLPHVLEALDDGTFRFGPAVWTTRKAGSEDTIPAPTFVDRRIDDVFVFGNRLGFIARDSIVLSSSNDLFNFFGLTVTQVLDTAPIDVSAADSAAAFHGATPFQDSLILWGERRQVALLSQGPLTPRSVSIRPLTQYAASALVRPVVLGQEVYFPKTVGEFSRLQSYSVRPDGLNYEADDATVQAPAYLPGDIRTLGTSPLVNTVVMLAPSTPNTLWVYKTYWDAGQKVQSAVYRWDFPETMTLEHAAFTRQSLTVVWSESGGQYLGTMQLADGYADPASPYLTHLDRRIGSERVTAVREGANTRVTLPYAPLADTVAVSRVPDEESSEVAKVIERGPSSLLLAGDWTARDYWVGDLFLMQFELSPLFARRPLPSGGSAADVTSRLQLRYLTLNYSGTGSFTVEVTNRTRSTIPTKFSALSTSRGIGEAVTDSVPISRSGSFRFAVQGRNTETRIVVKDKSHLPALFPSGEYEALLHNRTGTF